MALLLLIVFGLMYTGTFFYALRSVILGNTEGFFIFIIWGLPVYITVLSLVYICGYPYLVPILQSFKEFLILVTLPALVLQLRSSIRLQLADWLVICFFLLSAAYLFIPLGEYSFIQKLIAFKSISFFPFIYFTGRLIPLEKIVLNKLLTMICMLTIAASGISLTEYINNLHFQSITGYAVFNEDWFGQEVSGNYGLSWTFEIENGIKRFASLFSNPLEHAAATILALSVIAALYTEDKNRIRMRTIGWIALLASLGSILFALSRASMVSYFAVIFIYSLITGRKELLYIFYITVIAFLIYIFFFTIKDLREFAINTITFSNESSVGHLLEWITGLDAMISHPFGMGLGTSGRLSGFEGANIGGENQFIITGVQLGFAGLLLYMAIYFISIIQAITNYRYLKGKEQKIALIVILAKTGLFIPMFTSNLESYIYVSYMLWIFSGMFIQILEKRKNLNR